MEAEHSLIACEVLIVPAFPALAEKGCNVVKIYSVNTSVFWTSGRHHAS